MSDWTPPNSAYPPPKAGEPALHLAARLGHHDAIRSLVASGEAVDALFNIRLDPDERAQPATPLMVAAGSADGATVDTVRLLLQLGASVGAAPAEMSALSYACEGLGWKYPPGLAPKRTSVSRFAFMTCEAPRTRSRHQPGRALAS